MNKQVHQRPGRWARLFSEQKRDAPDDRGVTLVELLMVMAITSIVGALVMATIVIVGNLVTRTTERTEEFITAKQALDEISVNLRGSTNFEQSRGRLTDAAPFAVVFYTASGRGLQQDPQLMSYLVMGDKLYRFNGDYDPNTKKWDINKNSQRHVLVSGLTNPNIFEFYTWNDPKKLPAGTPISQQSCFRKLTEEELKKDPGGIQNGGTTVEGSAVVGLHARNAIAGVKVTIDVKDSRNTRFKESQGHTTWVRLGESIEPKDASTGALIEGWPQNCWKVFEDDVKNPGN